MNARVLPFPIRSGHRLSHSGQSGAVVLTDDEETQLYQAKKMLQLVEDLSQSDLTAPCGSINREALAVFAQVVGGLIPSR
ncbi:hypothetical protein [Methylovulum psychrotolerans]|uniref:Uncharacterized protein n=1 Tax=Methylovulum psychrotolerans TaxID=1704499 RepID=A0A1Z4C0D6_9GAMM|nr:hypothetical protein [Methylovulum psychrotolerans]ASF47014.1 hypothetical protein CEK71_13550 [Methylovulum psychrotolerans]